MVLSSVYRVLRLNSARTCSGTQSIGDSPVALRWYDWPEGTRSDSWGRFSGPPFSWTCPNGGTGRRARLTSVRRQRRTGSNPVSGTPSQANLTRRTIRDMVRVLVRRAQQPLFKQNPRSHLARGFCVFKNSERATCAARPDLLLQPSDYGISAGFTSTFTPKSFHVFTFCRNASARSFTFTSSLAVVSVTTPRSRSTFFTAFVNVESLRTASS